MDAPGSPKPKRSLFNRPAWARDESAKSESTGPADTESTITDVFTQSSRSYQERIAQQERERLAKERKKKEKQERRVSASNSRRRDESAVTNGKRRRISGEDNLPSHDERLASPSEAMLESARAPVSTLSHEEIESQFPVEPPPQVRGEHDLSPIAIDDSDEGSPPPAKPSLYQSAFNPADSLEDASDEEFPELAAQARERRRQRELEQKRSATPAGGSFAEDSRPGSAQYRNLEGSLPTPPAPDPVLQILVTSPIPNTKPLIVRRKLSQRLQEIRQVWCDKQGFTDEMQSSVFLTYCMRRLYDVTTCKSLGIKVDASGNVIARGGSAVFEGVENANRIHIEAVTEELFEQMKRDKQMKERRPDSLSHDHKSDVETPVADGLEEAPQEDEHIRIILKAKGLEPFKLKVKPVSGISSFISACFKANIVLDHAVLENIVVFSHPSPCQCR